MLRLAALCITVFSFLLLAGCSQKTATENTAPSSRSVQNDIGTDAVSTDAPAEGPETEPLENPSDAPNKSTPAETTALPTDPSLETPAAKEAIKFFNDLLLDEIPPIFSSVDNLNPDYAETISLLHTNSISTTMTDDGEVYFRRLKDVEATAELIFGMGAKISHKGAYAIEYKDEKQGYDSTGFGIEATYESIPVAISENETTVLLKVKLILCVEGYYDYDGKTFLGEDYTQAVIKTKSPLYQVTLTKKPNGGFYFTGFGVAPPPKDPSLETPAAKEAIELFYRLLLEDIPPYFTSLDELDNEYAEMIALRHTGICITENTGDGEQYFRSLSDVEYIAKYIFGEGVQIAHNGALAFIFISERTGYVSGGFGIENTYTSIPIKYEEHECTITLYVKLIWYVAGNFSDDYDEVYLDYDKRTILSEDYNEAAMKTKSPLYQVTLTKKPEGGFYFTGFQLAEN